MRSIKNKKPILLVVRPKRDTCRAFYGFFKLFDVDYLDIGSVSNIAPYFIQGLRKRVKNCDVVNISDNYYFYNAQVVFWAKIYKKPVVTILWATIPNHISSWFPPYSLISRYVVKNTKLFILRNKSAYGFAKSLGIKDGKLKIIYKGVDIKHFYPKKRKFSDKVTILYVGRMIASKGVCDLFSVFRDLYKKHKNIELVFAGSGRYKKYLFNKSNNIPVKFLDFVSYNSLPEIYRKADIFCSPSKEINFLGIKIWEEYFSYTLMEAQMSGLCIVAGHSKGVSEEVGRDNFLIKGGDRKSLYNNLEKLILDSDLRRRIGRINRQRAKRLYDAEVQAGKTEREIIKIC